MGIVLCPTLLFIDDDDWEIEDKKEKFLDNLVRLFTYIQDHDLNILWNSDLDNLLWVQPFLHPWLDTNITLVTEILYNHIDQREESCNFSSCDVEPEIITNIDDKDIITPTLSLIHYMIVQPETFEFAVDEVNNKNFSFSCKCHDITLQAETLYIFNDVINIVAEIEDKWGDIKRDSSILTDLINLMKERYFPDKNLLYTPEYDNMFVHSLSKMTEDREKVIYTLTKRLTLSPLEASQLNGLNDESIKGSSKRSIRIDGVCRVYYKYKNNAMLFLDYTGESQHNKGTRHT